MVPADWTVPLFGIMSLVSIRLTWLTCRTIHDALRGLVCALPSTVVLSCSNRLQLMAADG